MITMLSEAVLRTQPDERLAALAAAGSEPAFEALVRRYRRPLLTYCRRLLLSEARSEDVIQQVFLSAWSALRDGTEVRAVRPWLYRITHNQAVSAMRVPGYDFDELSGSLRGTDGPETDLERRVLMRETLAAVAALPELQRQAILRTSVAGRSYEEVADELGISGPAVRGLVYRARMTVRTGVGAFAPAPLVMSAAQGRRAGGVAQWLSELVGGGGVAGGAVVAAKSVTIIATSAALVGGTVGHAVVPPHAATHPVAHHRSQPARTAVRRAAPVSLSPAAPTASPVRFPGLATRAAAGGPATAGAATPSRAAHVVRQSEASLSPRAPAQSQRVRQAAPAAQPQPQAQAAASPAGTGTPSAGTGTPSAGTAAVPAQADAPAGAEAQNPGFSQGFDER